MRYVGACSMDVSSEALTAVAGKRFLAASALPSSTIIRTDCF